MHIKMWHASFFFILYAFVSLTWEEKKKNPYPDV